MSLKGIITDCIKMGNYEEIIAHGRENQAQALRYVQMNLFGNYDEILRWLALEALGRLAKEFSEGQDEVYRNVIRRALWAMNDESGNVPWSAPEMMAVVIKASPKQFASFIPLLITNALDNPMCHRGMLWSIGYLGEEHLAAIQPFLSEILPLLGSQDGDIRGYAVWALGVLNYEPAKEDIVALTDDVATLMLYHDGKLEKCSIGEIAKGLCKK